MLDRTAPALLLVLLPLLAGCGRPLTPHQTLDLFARMRRATSTQPMTGRFTTSVRVEDQVLTAEARVHRGADRAVTEYLSGRYVGWQVIEEDGLVWRVDPEGKPRAGQGMADGRASGVRPGATGLRVVRSLGIRRVAGRPVQRYVVRSPGRTRARAVIDVDTATGFPLSSVRYDARGKVVSRTTFSEVSFGGEPPARVEVPGVAQSRGAGGRALKTRPASEAELAQALGGRLLRPTALPAGFSATGSYLSQSPRGAIAELRYSDGLRVMVLVQMDLPAAQKPAPERRLAPERTVRQPHGDKKPWRRWLLPGRQGTDRASAELRQALRSRLRGHTVRERRGNRLLILAGDLEAPELQRVLDSIPGSQAPPPGASGPT